MFNRFQSKYKRFQISKSPQLNLVWGFFLYTVLGFVVLSIPLFHKESIPFLDNLFISTSAISTTGLVSVSIFDSYNFFGQLVIMLLIQLGGIGYMTLTTYFIFYTTKRITRWHQKVIGTEFTIPKSIQIRDFIRSVIYFTLLMETLGAIAFYIVFHHEGISGFKGIWFSIFHSVSSFCTAGFSLFDDSFVQFSDNTSINLIISILSIAGSLGFIVITDLWYRITGKSKSLTFTTKIIVYGFIVLLGLGTLIIYTTEPLIAASSNPLTESFFQSMTAMTTVGFNTVDTGSLSSPIMLLVIFLMYIGASPSGTAGGMKITTLTAMVSILKSRLWGQRKVTFLKRTIPIERLYVATSTFILYTSLIFLFSFLMTFSEKFSFEEILFEVSSALGTVGLSTGITGDLSPLGKIYLILLMFIGRVGVLTFGFALLRREKKKQLIPKKDDLAV